jgi:hypothetical protein
MSMDYHATGALGDRKEAMRLCALFLALCTCGCASPLAPARQAFDEARYPDAIAGYRALRRELPELSPRQLFEYALYRGLSHLALGDARPAERWLLVAKRLAEASPGLPSSEEQGRLSSAWRAMGHMPGD